LLDRIAAREISANQLSQLADWLKRFPGMIVCGEGALVKRSYGRGRFLWVKK
jgi:hypothetical protein